MCFVDQHVNLSYQVIQCIWMQFISSVLWTACHPAILTLACGIAVGKWYSIFLCCPWLVVDLLQHNNSILISLWTSTIAINITHYCNPYMKVDDREISVMNVNYLCNIYFTCHYLLLLFCSPNTQQEWNPYTLCFFYIEWHMNLIGP